MKKTIYLHIGAGKTGTTSIQQMLFDNKDVLEKHGWLYLVNAPNIDHCDIVDWSPGMQEKIRTDFGRLKQCLDESSCNNMIISSEHMIALDKDILDMIKEIFSDTATVKVIAYIRNQVEHIQTHFLQKQRDPFPYPGFYIQDFFRQFKDTFGNEHNFIMRNWEAVFDKENIIVKIYERYALQGQNICLDFAKTINIASFLPSFNYFINDSLIPEISSLISKIDSHFPQLVQKTSDSFSFRQNELMKKLLLLSDIYKKETKANRSVILLDYICNSLKNHFSIINMPSNVINAFKETRTNLVRNKRVSLIDQELKNDILNYYKDTNFKFASAYLNETERNDFLKYYF